MLVVKNQPANAGDERDASLILESGRFPGVGNGNTLQQKTPWTEEPGRLKSMGNKELDTTERLSTQLLLDCTFRYQLLNTHQL